MDHNALEKYCTLIYSIVGKEAVINESVSNEVVSDYYSKSAFLYKTFHSKEGAMHFPLKFSEESSHKKKLLFQAETVDAIINKNNYTAVLELGCGMGFNTNFLAEKNPAKKFTGVDLTPNNIKISKQKSKGMNNASFYQMDYDKMGSTNDKYDLIFAVETLCHSKDLITLLNNLSSKLNDNGRIIIFDGYVKPNKADLTNEFEIGAYKLLSWGFALPSFQKLDDVVDSKKIGDLKIDTISNYSENILSNSLTFQNGSIKALGYPILLKFLLKSRIISLAFIKQIAAGLFCNYFVKNDYLGYYKLELTK